MVAVEGKGNHDRTRPNPRRTIYPGNIPSDVDPLRHESSSHWGAGAAAAAPLDEKRLRRKMRVETVGGGRRPKRPGLALGAAFGVVLGATGGVAWQRSCWTGRELARSSRFGWTIGSKRAFDSSFFIIFISFLKI
jgi:hypothetical protein